MAEKQISKTRLVIIGGSSGSLEVLMKILPNLKDAFPVPIIIVLHRNTVADSGLTELLSSKTTLLVKEVDDKEIMDPACIYLAPPDYHLLAETDGSLSLDDSEKVNYCRPSIDVSFISTAVAYRSGVVAILLSGANADGAAGIKAVADRGGYTIVQDPQEASVSYMPEQALLTQAVTSVKSTDEITAFLNRIIT